MIETPRLVLRPMRPDDVDGLLRVFGDPKVMAAFDSEPFARPRMEQWVRRNLAHQERYGYGLFSIVLKADGTLVGDCGLEHLEDGAGEVELGYDLRRDSWNRGLATEAAGAVRDHAFGVLELPRLVSLIRQGNAASRRVAEKIGMRHEADVERYGQGYWRYAVARGDVVRDETP